MPTYDYRCENDGRVVSVWHSMQHRPATWGELCALTGADRGDTPADTPLTRLVAASCVITPKAGEEQSTPVRAHKHRRGCGCGT
jgi:hypothetical protein